MHFSSIVRPYTNLSDNTVFALLLTCYVSLGNISPSELSPVHSCMLEPPSGEEGALPQSPF